MMVKLSFVRIDFRLIHGQVITKWIRQTNTNKILIIDDELAKDNFLLNIYTMAAPPGIPVNVYSIEEAVTRWKDGTFVDGNIFVLFKNIQSIYCAITQGLPISTFQIGGLGFSSGRKNVHGAISLDNNDAKMLKELSELGVRIYFQQVPDENKSSLDEILKKYDFEL